MAFCSVAEGQSTPYPVPPDTLVMTPGGVDMRSGRYITSALDLSAGGLEFRRMTRQSRGDTLKTITGTPFGQFSHNWEMSITERPRPPSPGSGYNVSVNIGSTSTTFYTYNRTSFGVISMSDSSQSLTRTATAGGTHFYTYRSGGGRVVQFNPTATGAGAFATSITLGDGTEYTLSYDAGARLSRVVSNSGYALILEYDPLSYISKVCALNLTTIALPGTFSCPVGAPATSYGYASSLLATITDPSNAVSQITNSYVNGTTNFVERFISPGESVPYLINSYVYNADFGKFFVVDQAFSDGRTYHYDWTEFGMGEPSSGTLIIGTGYTDNLNRHTAFTYQTYQNISTIPPAITPGPITVTDPLNRTISFGYDGAFSRVTSRTAPQGMVDVFTYDSFNNVIQKQTSPNTGSSLSSLALQASYDCSTLVYCNKPVSITDARGNVTNYSYDPVHGGVLTESAAAGANNIRSVTRTAYAQRYAWIKSGSGYAPAASPIWVRTETRICRTSATVNNACNAGAGDEVVTSYDYGPNSGPNNLLLRGVAVTAGGQTLRTCYSYDANGRKLSETKPAANLSVCP